MSILRASSFPLVLSFALLTVVGACSSDHATEPGDVKDPQIPLITTLLVSAPSTINTRGQLQLSVGTSGEDTYTYISASPGSASGVTASITNRTLYRQSGTTKSVEVTIEDGGFDPVRVAASAGDTLQIEFLAADRSALLVGAAVVPNVRPPTIVRTNPRPGKKDVPLNSRLEIVFSEPIDPATITTENIQVITKGARVAGSLVQTDAFTVTFVPAESLRPMTSFQIFISTGVRNLGGIGLEKESSVPFETGAATDTSVSGCTSDGGCVAFVRDGSIYTTAVVGSGTIDPSGGAGAATLLPLGFAADEPVWSPDGHNLAFVDWMRTKLCVADPTGGEAKCAQVFTDHRPSWSPDGRELAFVGSLQPDNPHQPGPRQLFALKISDMSLRVILQDVGKFCGTSVSWSPDGERIAFTSLPSMCGGLVTVRPDGSDLHIVRDLNPADPIRSIEWSSDGQRFAVLTSGLLGTLNVDGTGWQPLDSSYWGESSGPGRSSTPEIFESLAWSSDGSSILYDAGWNCFMGCSDNRILFVKSDGSERGTVLMNARAPTLRRPIR